MATETLRAGARALPLPLPTPTFRQMNPCAAQNAGAGAATPLFCVGDKRTPEVPHVTPGNERVHRTLPPASIEGVLP